MEFIAGIIKFITTVNKMKKKVGGKVSLITAAVKALIAYAMGLLFQLILFCVIIYGMIYAVTDLFNWFNSKTSNIYQKSQNLSQAELDEISQFSAFLNPKKLYTYIDKEKESIPSSTTGTKITIKGITGQAPSSTTNQTVNLGVSSITNKYIMPWQYLASIDIVSGKALDEKNKDVVNSSSMIKPKFNWATGYSNDVIDYYKEWTVKTKEDPKLGTTTVSNGESTAKEHYTEVRTPKAILSSVETMFGTDTYSVIKDIVVSNEPYSKSYAVSGTRKVYKTEQVFDHLEDDLTKPIYKTVYDYEKYDVFKYKRSASSLWWSTVEVPSTYNPSLTDKTKVYTYSSGSYYFNNLNEKVYIPSSFLGSEPILQVSKIQYSSTYDKKVGSHQVLTGYEQKRVYRTVKYYKTTYKKTRRKVVSDEQGGCTSNFDPTNFIRFINDNGVYVADLELVKMSLETMPNASSYADKIKRIIDGDYGDIGDASPNGGGGGSGGGGGFGSGSVPVFYQGDPRWGGNSYASETIALAGCGPTTMAMIVTGLYGNLTGIDTNKDGVVDPAESAAWSTSHGYATNGNGTSNAFIDAIAKQAGLKAQETQNGNDVYEALKKGKLVVCNVAPGTIIRGYHFLALVGVNSQGKVIMHDPARATNTYVDGDKAKGYRGWDMDIIKADAMRYWIVENPNLTSTQQIIATWVSKAPKLADHQYSLISKLATGAVQSYIRDGVFPSITMAQAVEEGGWTPSTLATQYNNVFGIKADSSWTGPTVELGTLENYNDHIVARWRVYSSWEESIVDHGRFLVVNPIYAQHGFFRATDYRGQAQALEDAGYATVKDASGTPIYADKLSSHIDYNMFYVFDDQAKILKSQMGR